VLGVDLGSRDDAERYLDLDLKYRKALGMTRKGQA
jgi:hypothetical protein